MTADRRLRIGGWAALLVAALAPLRVVALFLSAGSEDPYAAPAVRAIDLANVVAVLVAVLGLDGLFRTFSAQGADRLRAIGVGAAFVGAGAAATPLGGAAVVTSMVGGLLLGAWFVGGGTLLMGQGGALLRVGWTAALGGVGVIVTALAIAASFGGPVGTGGSLIDWFHLLSLFVVIYLIRVWSYVVRGKLPGPGVL